MGLFVFSTLVNTISPHCSVALWVFMLSLKKNGEEGYWWRNWQYPFNLWVKQGYIAFGGENKTLQMIYMDSVYTRAACFSLSINVCCKPFWCKWSWAQECHFSTSKLCGYNCSHCWKHISQVFFFFIFIISPSNSTGISLVIINSLMYKKKSWKFTFYNICRLYLNFRIFKEKTVVTLELDEILKKKIF